MIIRFFVAVAFVVLISSCGSTEEKRKTVSDQIRVSLDTVLVDAGNEFLFLQEGIHSSAMSDDKKYLINFNRKDFTAEKIDLDRLKLEKKISYEKEGPNGLATDFPQYALLNDHNLLFWSYNLYKIFDQEGQLVRDLELDKIAPEYLTGHEHYPMELFQDENNPDRFVALIYNWESEVYFLLDFDVKERTYKRTDLPGLQKNSDYNVKILIEGNIAGGYGTSVFSVQANNTIQVSSNSYNEVHVFDLKTDSLSVKTWDTPLLGYKRAYIPPETVDRATGQLKDIIRKSGEDVSFQKFIWDDKNKRYLRFSKRKHFGEELNKYNEYVVIGADVYLSVFDADFNLVAEAPIPELSQPPRYHFVKDGNIWIFENIDDEMAFVIVKIDDV